MLICPFFYSFVPLLPYGISALQIEILDITFTEEF